YGYIKNHMKTVKNKQARTRERKSEQKPEAKPEKVNPTVYSSQSWSTKGQMGEGNLNFSLEPESHVAMVKAQIYVGFALNSLTKEAQAVTSRNDSLAILKYTQMIQRLTIAFK
ncbi:hypothetical protein Tco_0683126, partial [Tanacetum coccineum]